MKAIIKEILKDVPSSENVFRVWEYYRPHIEKADDIEWLMKDRAIAIGIVAAYCMLHDKSEWAEVIPECKFVVPLNGYEFEGVLDAWFRDKKGKTGVHEIKTTGERSIAKYLDTLHMDDQSTGYIWAADVDYMLYTVCRKTMLKQCTWESVEKYCVRVIKDYVTKPDKYIFREPVYKGKRDIDLWVQEMKECIGDMENCTKFYPTKRCTMFGGCDFLGLCKVMGDEATKEELFYVDKQR